MTPPYEEFPPRPPAEEPSSSSGSTYGEDPTRVVGSGSDLGDREPSLTVGPSIEGYALEDEIHRGGQGVVYRAVQLGTKRDVALKVLLEGPYASETTRQRFEREIELAASLRHSNIVQILDSGLSRGRYFFAMELVDGLRLDRYVAQKRPSTDEILELFEKVCLAINYAHQRGVIHRDLKPANILVDDEGEPHVLDFGLAKPAQRVAGGETTVQVLSTSGQLLGTIAYMSPEQAAGSQDVDVRSDVYSLGVVFYDALVGQPPYPVDGPLAEVLTRIAHDDAANPRSLALQADPERTVDDELATILLKALEKEPQRRYQTAGELARDFRHLLDGEPIEAKRASGLYMLRKTLRRYRLQAITAGVILLMLIGSMVTFAVLFARQSEARARADEKTREAQLAIESKDAALAEARTRTAEAEEAQRRLRRALARQYIQRGDLALARDDLITARDSYWDAMEIAPGPAATWALRRYHLLTANSGAALFTLESHGPTQLSPDGELTAVCPAPDAIWVREARTGASVQWVPTPGPIERLDLRSDGTLAAVGLGWLRVWQPGVLQPVVAANLRPGQETEALYALESGDGAFLVTPRNVMLFRGAAGQQVSIARLRDAPIGPSDFAPGLKLLAVPTFAGVETVRLTDDGLERAIVWSDPQRPARAVRFDGQRALAVLADAIYTFDLEARGGPAWRLFTRLAPPVGSEDPNDPSTGWTFFDFRFELGVAALATAAGEIGIARREEDAETWRFAVEQLNEIRLVEQDLALVAIDAQGTLTRWVQPGRVEQQRSLQIADPVAWAASPDGSAALIAVDRGRVVAYVPALAQMPFTVVKPPWFAGLRRGGTERYALALDASGTRVVVRDGNSLRFQNVRTLEHATRAWTDPRFTQTDHLALSGDGELVALLARSNLGERQRVSFLRWSTDPSEPLDDTPPPFDFVGSEIRALQFLPGTHELLVLRSNGQIFRLDPHATERPPAVADEAGAASPLEPWMTLDATPERIAISRTGEYLAVAAADGTLRLISVPRAMERHRLNIGPQVTSLAFNPRDDVLMLRAADGEVQLWDPATAENVARWDLPAGEDPPLGLWVGEAGAMVLSQGDDVREYRYERADALIEESRPYVQQRRIARHLANGEQREAWSRASTTGRFVRDAARAIQINLLEIALRREQQEIPMSWAYAFLADADAATCLRLGHAAYAGQQFELARRWLARGAELYDGVLDAVSLLRLAQAEYVTEDHAAAAERFAEVLERPDLDPELRPTVQLQRVASLVLAGQPGAARRAALLIGRSDGWGRRGDPVALSSARILSRAITGLEDEALAAAAFDSLLTTFDQRGLLYWDDGKFFAGEIARQRGDATEAAVQYQRCIDLSRDPWPANWARHRLDQIAKTVN
jgi:predicted Ser/Thr protein kinase/tetratricopeptide (TPR) repeat protein